MTAVGALEFNAWLTQPGNHRLVLKIKDKLSAFLNRDVQLRSWADVYNLFEECFPKNETSKSLFEPFFKVQPPTPSSGASARQIQMYRGAFIDKSVLEQPDIDRVKQVTYRGQKLDVAVESGAQTKACEAETSVSPRYYRGVRIN